MLCLCVVFLKSLRRVLNCSGLRSQCVWARRSAQLVYLSDAPQQCHGIQCVSCFSRSALHFHTKEQPAHHYGIVVDHLVLSSSRRYCSNCCLTSSLILSVRVFTSVAVVVRITGHHGSSVKVRRENKTLHPQPANHSSDLKHITQQAANQRADFIIFESLFTE